MIEHSPDITEFAKAFHAAQGAVEGVRKDSKNPHFKNNYASLEAVIDTARPALQANGLAFSQAPGALVDGCVEVTTEIMHAASGQWMRSTLHVPLGKRDAQGVGSAITYGCRYSLMAMLGLPPVDDDGQAASRPAPAPVPHRTQSAPQLPADEQGAADHLIELISHARSEPDLDRVSKSDANIALYQNLEPAEQDRVSSAIASRRAALSQRRIAR